MKEPVRQYTSDSQTTLGEKMDDAGIVSSAVSDNQATDDVDTDSNAPDEHDENGPVHNSDEDESGVDRRGKNDGALTGTDNDKTGLGENMATES